MPEQNFWVIMSFSGSLYKEQKKVTVIRTKDLSDISCQYIKAVGPQRAAVLGRLGIKSVEDLLYTVPRRYEDRSSFTPIASLKNGQKVTICGIVISKGKKRLRKRREVLEVALKDESGTLLAVWFNQVYLYDRFQVGDSLVLSGKVSWYHGVRMANPDYEVLAGDETDIINSGRIVPFYPLTEKLTHRAMRLIVKNAIGYYKSEMVEIFPIQMRQKKSLLGIYEAISLIHYPEKIEDVAAARRRLVFEEFLILQLAIELKKRTIQKLPRIYRVRDGESLVDLFVEKLPFRLTHDQFKTINDMMCDMKGDMPMNRLLQGDVGSGKTVLACAALFLAVKSGCQGVLMVPSEVLAEQHYESLQLMFKPFDMRIGLLVGEMKASAREELLNDVAMGHIQILVGTHAILEERVQFHKLGIVVIDEQHKFGVAQRYQLRIKGEVPDVVVMTATPIPRTLALTLYGDLDVSVIKEMPPGRAKIETYWIKENKMMEAYDFVRDQIKLGRQAYIVYPLVEETEKTLLKAVTEMYKKLSSIIFPDLDIGLIHGRQSVKEKNKALDDFKRGIHKILISTTVVEVGIDVPNATVMLIENAERFGLAQLHQLRGRVGRSSHKSYCILEADPHTEEGVRRMKAMCRTSDGFEIAEEDLSIRGPGEILGTRQHGLPELRVANLSFDIELLVEAKEFAREILVEDPHLEESQHARIKRALLLRYRERVHFAEVG